MQKERGDYDKIQIQTTRAHFNHPDRKTKWPSAQPGRTPGQDLVPVHSYPTAFIQGRSYMGLWPAALHGSSGAKFHIDHNLLVLRDIEKERLSVH